MTPSRDTFTLKIGLFIASALLVIIATAVDLKTFHPQISTLLSAGSAFGSVYIGFFISDMFTENQKKSISQMLDSAIEKIGTKGRRATPYEMPIQLFVYYVSSDINTVRYWQLTVIDIDSTIGVDSWIGNFSIRNDSGTEISYKTDVQLMNRVAILINTSLEQISNERSAVNVLTHMRPGIQGFGVSIHEDWHSKLRIDPLIVLKTPFKGINRNLWPTKTCRITDPVMVHELDNFCKAQLPKADQFDHLLQAMVPAPPPTPTPPA